MAVNMSTSGVHHLALRVSDFERAKRFYLDTLGFSPIAELPNLLLFMAGGTAIGIRGPDEETPQGIGSTPTASASTTWRWPVAMKLSWSA